MATKLEEFKGRVDQYVAAGMSRDKAVAQVANKFPALHDAMLEEANAGTPPLASGTPTGEAAIAEWNRRFEALVEGGMDRTRAVVKMGNESPSLRQAYVEAVNAKRPPHRRHGGRRR